MVRIKMLRLLCVLLLLSAGRAFAGKVDTLKLQEKCNALDKEISDFESMIDVALSVSNANTNITVMY